MVVFAKFCLLNPLDTGDLSPSLMDTFASVSVELYVGCHQNANYLVYGPNNSIFISFSKGARTCSSMVFENSWVDKLALGFIKH